MDFKRTITEATLLQLQGLKITIEISLIAIVIGMIIGLLACLMGMSKNPLLKGISAIYVWVIRGTPMLTQAFIIYFGIPQIIGLFVPGFRLDAISAGIITLSLNAGAYLSEIFRGGISAVPKGQTEAARSLGLSHVRTMWRVVLPQAIKITIPSMVNQFIITIKDSSILSVIGLAELMNKSKVYVGASYQFFATYVMAAFYYLVIISILMIVARKVERNLNYERKN